MLIPNQPNSTPLRTCAILLAAGSGNRMGTEDKILSTLGEIPVLFHSLEALNSSSDIFSIISALALAISFKVSKFLK